MLYMQHYGTKSYVNRLIKKRFPRVFSILIMKIENLMAIFVGFPFGLSVAGGAVK